MGKFKYVFFGLPAVLFLLFCIVSCEQEDLTVMEDNTYSVIFDANGFM